MALLISIADLDDPRVSLYAKVRERDLRGRGQSFVAEGDVVVHLLLSERSLHRPESLFVSERRLRAVAPLLERAPPDLPVYVAPQAVMDAVVGFPIHRGVLALGRRGEPLEAGRLLGGLGPGALVLGLVGIANHDNMGGLFRNAAAFGAAAVLLDDASCDPLYRKAIRVSVGASLLVPFARAGSAAAMADLLTGAGFELLALTPAGAERIEAVAAPGRAALLLGAEGPGLPEAILSRARPVRIAMAPGFDSLNVATASGIALHRLTEPHLS